MASTTIHSLLYKVVCDSHAFTKGIVATKSELSAAKKLFLESRTPAEQYGASLDALDKIHAKGAIDAETHRRSIERLNKEMSEGSSVGMKGAGDSNFPSLTKVAVAAGVASLAIKGVHAAVNLIPETFDKFDQLGDKADQLGVSMREFQQIQFIGRESGLDAEKTTGAIQGMQEALGKAATMGGKTEKMLKAVGIDAKSLVGLPLPEQLESVAAAFAKMDSNEERSFFLKALKLGPEMGPMLDKIGEGLDSAAKDGEAFGMVLSDIDNAKLSQAADAMERLGDLTESYKTKIALASTSTVTAAADIGEAIARMQEKNKSLTTAGGWLAVLLDPLFGTADKIEEEIAKETVKRKQAEADAAEQKKLEPSRRVDAMIADVGSNDDAIEKMRDKLEKAGMTAGEKDLLDIKADGAKQISEAQSVADKVAALYESGKANVDQLLASKKALQDVKEDVAAQMDEAEGINAKLEELALEKELTKERERARKEAENALKQHDKERESFVGKLLEKTQTDAEKLAEGMTKINEAFLTGGIDAAEADAADKRLAEDLVKDDVEKMKKQEADTGKRRPEAVQRGTAEAFSAIMRGMDRDKTDVGKQTRDHTKATAEAVNRLIVEAQKIKPPNVMTF